MVWHAQDQEKWRDSQYSVESGWPQMQRVLGETGQVAVRTHGPEYSPVPGGAAKRTCSAASVGEASMRVMYLLAITAAVAPFTFPLRTSFPMHAIKALTVPQTRVTVSVIQSAARDSETVGGVERTLGAYSTPALNT